MTSRVFRVIAGFGMACLLSAHAFGAQESNRVAIVMSAKVKIYELISKGLEEKLDARMLEIVLSDGNEKSLESIGHFEPQVIIAVGDAAALWARTKIAKIPIVACGVMSQYNSRKFQGLAGVSLDFPLQFYLRLIRDAVPGIRHVGLLFDSSQSTNFAADSERAARELGLKVYAYPIEKEKEVGRALQLLKESGAEIFLMTYDPLIMNPEIFRYLVDFSITNRLALMVPSKALLKSGGVLAYEADYTEVGRQTAELVGRFLNGEKLTAGLSYPNRGEIGINLKVARILGVTVSANILKKADHIYE